MLTSLYPQPTTYQFQMNPIIHQFRATGKLSASRRPSHVLVPCPYFPLNLFLSAEIRLASKLNISHPRHSKLLHDKQQQAGTKHSLSAGFIPFADARSRGQVRL